MPSQYDLESDKVEIIDEVELPTRDVILEAGDNGYKYQEIFEASAILHNKMKKQVQTVGLKQLKTFLKSQLNAVKQLRSSGIVLRLSTSQAKNCKPLYLS